MLGHFLLLHVLVHNLLLQTRENKAVKTGKNCRVRLPRIYERKHIDKVLKVDSHLQFIRNELLSELFSPNSCKNGYTTQLLNFSVHAKVDQIASANAPTLYSTTHYLTNSSSNSPRLINRKYEWIITYPGYGDSDDEQ